MFYYWALSGYNTTYAKVYYTPRLIRLKYLVDPSNCLYVNTERINLNYYQNIQFYFFQHEIFVFALFSHWALLLYNTTFIKLYYTPGFILLNFFRWALELFISKNGKNKFKLFSKDLVLIFSGVKDFYLFCCTIEHFHFIIQLILNYNTLLYLFYWTYLVKHPKCLYIKVERNIRFIL